MHPQLQQRVRRVAGEDERFASLANALRGEAQHQAVVFADSPGEADAVVKKLSAEGFEAGVPRQTADRGVAMDEFFNGDLPVLVCTDLAARGIDFPDPAPRRAGSTARRRARRCTCTGADAPRTGQEGPFIVTCLVDES